MILKSREDDECLTPYILSQNPLHDTLKIMADGIMVCQADNLLKAARLLLATFYVFNIAYPKGITASLTFFQKVFLNLQDDAKKNT